MKTILIVLLFLLGTASLAQAENEQLLQDKTDKRQSWGKMSLKKDVETTMAGADNSIRYFGKKFYFRQERKTKFGLADDSCEMDQRDSQAVWNSSRLGYAWREHFCLEGNFQFQSEGGASYGIQAVIRF